MNSISNLKKITLIKKK